MFSFGLFNATKVFGAVVPVTDVVIDLNARDQAISEFIETLFNEMNVPLVVHGELVGIVTGSFRGTANQIMDRVDTAFDVTIYFDGAVAHVYPSNRLIRRMLPISKSDARRVRGLVDRTELTDEYNSIEDEDGGLLITGVPRFIEQVEEFIALVKKTKQTRAVNKQIVKRKNTGKLNNNVKPVASTSKQAEYEYRVFKLKYAWAEDISYEVGSKSVLVPGIASLLRDLVFKQGASPSRSKIKANSKSLGGLRGTGLAESNTIEDTNLKVNSLESTDLAENSRVEDSSIPVQRTGTVRIITDSRINAVIVSDLKERMETYETLIESLDVPVEMVEIEATIIDINSDRSRELGIDWRGSFEDGSVSFTNGSDNPFSSLSQGGVLSLAFNEGVEFLARVRALEQKGAARVVSKPHIITLSNVEGVLGRTSEFFVRIAGDEEVDLFNVPVGTTLRVKPHVFRDKNLTKVKLIVNIEDGSQSASGAVVDEIPVVERASINTQAVISDGASLLVGGLARETFGRREFRVPILGSIPIVGRAFRDTSNSTSRIERLFLITPRVAKNEKFIAREDMPRLIGDDVGGFLPDSRRSLNSVDWPKEQAQVLWPRENRQEKYSLKKSQRDDTSTKHASNNLLSSAQVGLHTEQVSVENNNKFISPFKVEYWPSVE